MQAPFPERILLADDDDEMREVLSYSLREEGYHVTECAHGIAMLECLRAYLLDQEGDHYDLVVSDIRMPGLTGIELLTAGFEKGKFPPTILITSFGDPEMHHQARRLGAKALLDKPFELTALIAEVNRVLRGKAAR